MHKIVAVVVPYWERRSDINVLKRVDYVASTRSCLLVLACLVKVPLTPRTSSFRLLPTPPTVFELSL